MRYLFNRCERCGQVSSDLTEDGLCPLCDFAINGLPLTNCKCTLFDFGKEPDKTAYQIWMANIKKEKWITETISRVNEENKSLW